MHRKTGLSPPVKYFTDRSKAVLLLLIIWVISVLFCYAFMHVCLLMPCGNLLGKRWPLGSRLWCLIVTLSLSHWYPGSGVVLECIDSWSLPSFLLWRKLCCMRSTRAQASRVYSFDLFSALVSIHSLESRKRNYLHETFQYSRLPLWVRRLEWVLAACLCQSRVFPRRSSYYSFVYDHTKVRKFRIDEHWLMIHMIYCLLLYINFNLHIFQTVLIPRAWL